jgi:hypothetical protein
MNGRVEFLVILVGLLPASCSNGSDGPAYVDSAAGWLDGITDAASGIDAAGAELQRGQGDHSAFPADGCGRHFPDGAGDLALTDLGPGPDSLTDSGGGGGDGTVAGDAQQGCSPGCPPGLNCGQIIDQCGEKVSCGTCTLPEVCGYEMPNVCGSSGTPEALPYPEKTPYDVKGLQPDFWPDKDEIAGNGTGTVAVNLVWAFWEPAVESPPCGGGEEEYDGRCFKVDSGVDNEIKQYTSKGVVVTGVVYGVPAWAHQTIDCSPVAPGFEIFCAPDNAADYARFAGMLAKRYSGLSGNGRVADFVIHNEVNTNDWFDIGCGQGKACNSQAWMDTYADNYAKAYDAITVNQPYAKVLMSFTHHFDTAYDKPNQTNPTLSVKTFITAVAGKLGDREWRVAYHPYPPNLLKPAFSADDLPLVTYGNVGVIVGWLMAAFPNDPHAWDVQLTESGVNSLAPNSSAQAQVEGVCKSLYNVTGTPGISNYIYHRLKDHPAETAAGLGLGLRDTDGNPKPAWSTWALANRFDLSPPQLSCGFENLPFTRLVRAFKAGRGHWATTRKPPAGFAEEQVYALHYAKQPGTIMLYECMKGDDSFVSKEQSCEGHQPMGPLGYIHTDSVPNSVALYNCVSGNNSDHMISPEPDCEVYNTEHLLGYALTF